MSLHAGAVFAGYTIERVLGRGGMGMVYLARHPRLGSSVALKVLDVDPVTNSEARSAFDREAELAALLIHPNIVPVHDRSRPGDSTLWLSMRYIGRDCAALLSAEPTGLAPDRAVRLVTDAAHALDFAHEHNVMHRDVKPANLLIEHDPRHGERALLTDFGIARTFDDDSTKTSISATFAYAAPERFTTRPTDHRADQYSLGCTLYHLLTGRRPFPYVDEARVINAHISEPPPAPSEQRPGLPAALDVVIATALAKDPDRRYPSCVDLAEAAARAVFEQGGTTRTSRRADPGPSTSERRVSRRRLVIGGAAAVPAAGIAAALITRFGGSGPAQQQSPLPFIGLGKPHGVAVDAAGGVYVTDNANHRVVKMPAGSNNTETLPFDDLAGPTGIAVDASGNVYVADNPGNRVVKLSVRTNTSETLPFYELAAPTGVAVDAKGNVYVADYENHRVLRLPVGAHSPGEQAVLPFRDLRYPYGVAVAPQGDIYVTDTEKRQVLRLPSGSGNTQALPFDDLAGPTGTAVDNRGAVYVAAHADPLNDAEHNQVQRMAPGPGKPEMLPFSGLANPTGVAVDKWGVVYLADYDSNQVLQLRGTTATANSGG